MFLLAALIAVFGDVAFQARGGKVFPYIDQTQFTATPWGYKSHYTQPWRAWQATTPSSLLLSSTGTVIGDHCRTDSCSDLKARMLLRHGVKHV